MSKFCMNCGATLKEGVAFCQECGQKINANESSNNSKQENSDAPIKKIAANVSGQNDLKKKVLNNLTLVGAIIMLVGLFVGNFYTSSAGGGYLGTYLVKGYNIPFAGPWYGFILLIAPIVLLVSNRIDALKKYENMLNLGFSVASVLIIFVIKGQIVDFWGMVGSSASIAMGGWIYLLGNILALAICGLKAAGFKTDAESLEKMAREKNLNAAKANEE